MGEAEQRVKSIIKSQYGSVDEFARTFNLNGQTVASLLNKGSFATSRAENTITIARALELDPYSLIHGKLVDESSRFRGYVEVPLFGSIAAGQPIEAIQTDDRFPIPKELADKYPKSFLLRISGKSMNRILPDGCYALIERCSDFEHSGQPYAVTVGADNATVKRVFLLENGLRLAPDSDDPTAQQDFVFDYADENAEEVAIIGRVVWFCLPHNWRFG